MEKNMRVLCVSVRQALCGRAFFAGALGAACVSVLSAAEGLLEAFRATTPIESGYHMRLMLEILRSDAMCMCLPVLCALPYTASFVDDMRSGFVKAYLPRAGVKRYIWAKGLACALSGGLCVALGLIAACGMTALILSPLRKGGAGVVDESIPAIIEFLEGVILYFVSGALWATLGATFAAFTLSKYMAYASPFVLYYALTILCERYFISLYMFNPRQWLCPSDAWKCSRAGVVFLLILFIAALIICFARVAERKLKIL